MVVSLRVLPAIKPVHQRAASGLGGTPATIVPLDLWCKVHLTMRVLIRCKGVLPRGRSDAARRAKALVTGPVCNKTSGSIKAHVAPIDLIACPKTKG